MFTPEEDDEGRASGANASAPASEVERILEGLHVLRHLIIEAWNERAVMLTQEERQQLRHEIHETCDLLKDLTGSP